MDVYRIVGLGSSISLKSRHIGIKKILKMCFEGYRNRGICELLFLQIVVLLDREQGMDIAF